MANALSTRTQSGFPVSIGTGLALESLLDPVMVVFDEGREIPVKVKTEDYNVILVNTSTLLRNIISSISPEASTTVKHKDYLEVLQEEIQYLNDLFVMNDLEPVFYVNTYDYVKKVYPKEKLRVATTLKQLQLEMILNYCLTELQKSPSIRKYTNKVHTDMSHKALIMTHIPWDLLGYKEFLKLDLLESHTGLLKTRKDWYTKYHKLPNRDMSILPFTQELLSIMGDSVMFHPDPLKKRTEVYDTLVAKRVHPFTSSDIVKMYLGL
jgi:hypothetical protein